MSAGRAFLARMPFSAAQAVQLGEQIAPGVPEEMQTHDAEMLPDGFDVCHLIAPVDDGRGAYTALIERDHVIDDRASATGRQDQSSRDSQAPVQQTENTEHRRY